MQNFIFIKAKSNNFNISSIIIKELFMLFIIYIYYNKFFKIFKQALFFATSTCFSWWAVIRCWKFFSSWLSRSSVAHFQNLTYYTFFDLKEWSISSNFSFIFYNYYNKIFKVFKNERILIDGIHRFTSKPTVKSYLNLTNILYQNF